MSEQCLRQSPEWVGPSNPWQLARLPSDLFQEKDRFLALKNLVVAVSIASLAAIGKGTRPFSPLQALLSTECKHRLKVFDEEQRIAEHVAQYTVLPGRKCVPWPETADTALAAQYGSSDSHRRTSMACCIFGVEAFHVSKDFKS